MDLNESEGSASGSVEIRSETLSTWLIPTWLYRQAAV